MERDAQSVYFRFQPTECFFATSVFEASSGYALATALEIALRTPSYPEIVGEST